MKKSGFWAAVAIFVAACASEPKLQQEAPALGPTLSRYAVIYAVVDAPAEVREKPDYLIVSARLLRSFTDSLSALGKTVTTAPTTTDNALEARLTVTDFNNVSLAARILVGILAGQAKLDVTMTLKDAAKGTVITTISSTDSSSNLQGVFGADSDRQIEATANQLASKLDEVGTAPGLRLAGANSSPVPADAAAVKVPWEDLRRLAEPTPVQAGLFAAATPESNAADGPLAASQLFERLSPTVLGVRAVDAQNRPLAGGSAVIVAPRHAVTTCHVLARASAVELQRGTEKYRAMVAYADTERDVCVLTVDEHLAIPSAAPLAAGAKVGQRVYAITFAERLGLQFDEGLVTGVQTVDKALPPLRVAMPLAQGASGGGVFDERGRLIGIVTMNAPRAGLAPNANFVLPSGWIAETPGRSGKELRAAAAPVATTVASASAGPPVLAPGMTWTYRWRDRTYDRDRVFSVRATAVDGSGVTEMLTSGADQQTFVANSKEIGFQIRRISGDDFLELSPYLLARVPAPAMPLPQTPRGYAAAGDGEDWNIRVQRVRREVITVPAGRFDAYRVTVTGENAKLAFAYQSGPSSAGNDYRVARFEYDAWYAPDISRYVQIRHKTYGRQGKELSDESVQLTKFLPDAAPAK